MNSNQVSSTAQASYVGSQLTKDYTNVGYSLQGANKVYAIYGDLPGGGSALLNSIPFPPASNSFLECRITAYFGDALPYSFLFYVQINVDPTGVGSAHQFLNEYFPIVVHGVTAPTVANSGLLLSNGTATTPAILTFTVNSDAAHVTWQGFFTITQSRYPVVQTIT